MGYRDGDRSRKDDGRLKRYIAKSKTGAFKTLFNKVKDSVGGYDQAVAELNLSNGVMDGLNKGKLTEANAKKILHGYKRICES